MLLGVEVLHCSVLGSNLMLWGEIWDPAPTAKDVLQETLACLHCAVQCFALGETRVICLCCMQALPHDNGQKFAASRIGQGEEGQAQQLR